MKKRNLLLLLICSLFQLTIAGKSCEVEVKDSRIVITSIINYTPYDVLISDVNKNWNFVLESDHKIDSSSMVIGSTDYLDDQNCLENIYFHIIPIDDYDLDFDNRLYVAVELMDNTFDDKGNKIDDSYLFFGIGCLGKKSHSYAQDIDAHRSDTIEIELILIDLALYGQDCPEIAKQYKFFGVFTVLNE